MKHEKKLRRVINTLPAGAPVPTGKQLRKIEKARRALMKLSEQVSDTEDPNAVHALRGEWDKVADRFKRVGERFGATPF